MMTKLKYLVWAGCILTLFACHREDELTPVYEYAGAIPAITDGPSMARKLCYELYQKFDLQVYYTLEGAEALRTIIGVAQKTDFNESVLPLEAADEDIAVCFLTLLKKFNEMLPLKMAKATQLKRQILVKGMIVNPYQYTCFENYRSIAVSEGQQGIVYYGNMENEADTDWSIWKYSITYEYFRGITEHATKEAPLAVEFGKVSKGFYMWDYAEPYDVFYEYVINESPEGMEGEYTYYTMDEDALLEAGFVNPEGYSRGNSNTFVNEDLAAFATWIALYPKEQRQDILDTYPLVKKKYNLTLKYFTDVYQMDLEKFSDQWSAVTE